MPKSKRDAVLQRIGRIEEAITKAEAYLEDGEHAHWHKFRPIFGDRRDRPPHPDWVKNVFLVRQQRALARAERVLEQLTEKRQRKIARN